MTKSVRLAIAQVNFTVGDLEGNYKKITQYIRKAESFGVDIIAFPELAVTGYPPEDLLHKAKFIDDNVSTLKTLARSVGEMAAIVGFVDKDKKGIYNAAAVIYNGRVRGVYHKIFLPNYGVFDEKRYFKGGAGIGIFKAGDFVFGVSICEDIWHGDGPTKLEAGAGADFIININASPYHLGKTRERESVIRKEAKANKVGIMYANLIGGQDELVFDGQSIIMGKSGRILKKAGAFQEELLMADLVLPKASGKRAAGGIKLTDMIPARNKPTLTKESLKRLTPAAEIYKALTLGLGDYVSKNGFKKVVIGLSGGVDSALVTALAVDALGKDNVAGVFMPSRYSSDESKNDAGKLSSNLGIKLINIPIEEIFKSCIKTLTPHFIPPPSTPDFSPGIGGAGFAPDEWKPPAFKPGSFMGAGEDITEENLQARIRGNLLMALSNKFGWLVLTTGNKSEMSTGYATLYGDMAGGFAVIKDVPKTLVYKLARYRNSISCDIPENILTKEPTAELKPDQKDSDTLPPYETLDKILKAYIEDDMDSTEIVKGGFKKELVQKVLGMVDKSEYKRRQSPPGIKITPKAFGKDRRMPITNRYLVTC